MEDLPVGAEVTLKVVETKEADCSGCFFDEIANCINIRYGYCDSKRRSDHKNVIFKEVKE